MSSIADSEEQFGSFKFPCDVCINVRHLPNGQTDSVEEPVLAHRLVLSSFSTLFRQLLSSAKVEDKVATIDVDLSLLPNALNSFRAMLAALYTGDVNYALAQPAEVLSVCRACQVPTIESKVLSSAAMDFAHLFSTSPTEKQPHLDLATNNPMQNYLHTMMQLWMNSQNNSLLSAFCSAPFAIAPPTSPLVDDSASRTQSESRSSGSSPRANSVATPPADNEKIVPNDDKEGWCRNKKYIEKVDGGFMCTVCRKVYGRYNSVSYHVTIYHRNPPIRCDENGCNFSTREARYIHFHKYYRHHIALPENIDLGSRKCPFCRHVSKSPAMLEKHIARHDIDGRKCKDSPRGMKKTLSEQRPKSEPTTSSAAMPILSPLKCTFCAFSAISADALIVHLTTSHGPEISQFVTAVEQPQAIETPVNMELLKLEIDSSL